MDEKTFGNGIFDQLKPNYVTINPKDSLDYIENLILSITGIPKDRIK